MDFRSVQELDKLNGCRHRNSFDHGRLGLEKFRFMHDARARQSHKSCPHLADDVERFLDVPWDGTSCVEDKRSVLMEEVMSISEGKIPWISRFRQCCLNPDSLLMILTIAGVVLGFTAGFIFRSFDISHDALLWIAKPGDIFLRLLNLAVVPLIAANIIIVTSTLDPKVNGKISAVSLGYIIGANFISSVIGLVVSIILKPGAVGGVDHLHSNVDLVRLSTSDIFSDLLSNLFPDNLLGAALYKSRTVYQNISVRVRIDENITMETSADNITSLMVEREIKKAGTVPGGNMIGIIFCAVVFGSAARKKGSAGRPFLSFFQSLSDIVLLVMRWFLWMTPLGVASIIAAAVTEVKHISSTFSRLGLFIVTMIVGLAIHFVLMQFLLLVVSRKNPLRFLPLTYKTWAICFATASPIVAIPEMYECCDKAKFSKKVSRFVVPFSATLKSDTGALFAAAGAVFVAQASGVILDVSTAVVVVILVAVSLIAPPMIPNGAAVILVSILAAVGIPQEPVALLFAIEWITDRMRSGSMGISHCYCAAITQYVCAADLAEDEEETAEAGKVEDLDKIDSDNLLPSIAVPEKQ